MVAVTTDEVSGSATYGATEVVFDVVNAYKLDSIGEQFVVRQADPGWMNGYFFEVGLTYFVPLMARGPQGQPNWSFLCDPIFPMAIGQALDLPQFAADGLVIGSPDESPVLSIDDAPVTIASEVPAESSDDDSSSAVAIVGIVVVGLAALIIGWWLLRRRSAADGGPRSSPQ